MLFLKIEYENNLPKSSLSTLQLEKRGLLCTFFDSIFLPVLGPRKPNNNKKY